MSANASFGTGDRRLITLEEVGSRGLTIEIEAGVAEREALARSLDLLALEALAAKLRFEPAADAEGGIRVSGTIRARLVQRCAVTLEPVPCTLRESISILYAPLAADPPECEVNVPAEGEAPEPLPAAGIDASEVVAEHLALSLDPYPRHPDAPAGPLTYSAGEGTADEATARDDADDGPFAALGQLKSKL